MRLMKIHENYTKEFYSPSDRNSGNSNFNSSNDSAPIFDYKGEINDDGWEICEYPKDSGTWWWKDYETETWVCGNEINPCDWKPLQYLWYHLNRFVRFF